MEAVNEYRLKVQQERQLKNEKALAEAKANGTLHQTQKSKQSEEPSEGKRGFFSRLFG